eukprot:jgi/Hompol1/2986/HPOL_003085-RA
MSSSDKKDKKEKKAKVSAEEGGDSSEVSYESRLKAVTPIAHPLAPEKLCKKVLKVVKKAAKAKDVKRGIREVVKGLRKGAKGFVVLAGDISPLDVITHIPVICEDANVPYIYVPSREDLGSAGSTKRPTSCVMILAKKDAEYKDDYEKVLGEVKEANKTLLTAL